MKLQQAIIILAILLVSLTSYTGRYPEPLYYEINFNDGVIHKWHRNVYYDHGYIDSICDYTNKKYLGMTKYEITVSASLGVLEKNKQKRKEKIKEILYE